MILYIYIMPNSPGTQAADRKHGTWLNLIKDRSDMTYKISENQLQKQWVLQDRYSTAYLHELLSVPLDPQYVCSSSCNNSPILITFCYTIEKTGLLLHVDYQGKAIHSCHVASSPLFVRTNSPACSLHLFSTCIHRGSSRLLEIIVRYP